MIWMDLFIGLRKVKLPQEYTQGVFALSNAPSIQQHQLNKDEKVRSFSIVLHFTGQDTT